MSEQTFTQEQVTKAVEDARKEWLEKEYNPIIAERDELLQFKPKTLPDDEKALQQKQAELLQKEMELLMKEANVSDFTDLIAAKDAEELKSKIGKLNDVLKARTIDSSFKPDDHKQQSAFDVARAKGDTQGMIKTLFGLK